MKEHLMAEQILTQERLKELFFYDQETGIFKRYKKLGPKKEESGHICTSGYRQIMVDRKLYMAHKLAWLYVYGHFPKLLIDHINRKTDDNRIVNLRIATYSENQQNTKTRIDNLCGFKGITFDKTSKNWRARISKNGKTFHLGRFKTIELAINARKQAEDKFFTHHKG
jgi:HNH endonuclease/AP2 domain